MQFCELNGLAEQRRHRSHTHTHRGPGAPNALSERARVRGVSKSNQRNPSASHQNSIIQMHPPPRPAAPPVCLFGARWMSAVRAICTHLHTHARTHSVRIDLLCVKSVARFSLMRSGKKLRTMRAPSRLVAATSSTSTQTHTRTHAHTVFRCLPRRMDVAHMCVPRPPTHPNRSAHQT